MDVEMDTDSELSSGLSMADTFSSVSDFDNSEPTYSRPRLYEQLCSHARRTVLGIRCGKCPYKRSGHRAFANTDYLYIVGGFDSGVGNMPTSSTSTFCDIWAMNLLTKEWKLVRQIGKFDDTMASFSLTYVPELEKFYVYGGTGYPFAENVSNTLFECTLVEDDLCRIDVVPLEGDLPPRIYGQAAAYRLNGSTLELYMIGGTMGHEYNMSVYSLVIRQGRAVCTRLSQDIEEPEGRYRHEAVIHQDRILCIGGSDGTSFCSMESLDTFDLKYNRFRLAKVLPDPDHGYPRQRKGHAIVHYGNEVYMFGGTYASYPDPPGPNGVLVEKLWNSVWILDLSAMSWRRFSHALPSPVFFHASALTKEGQVLSYGGCVTCQPGPLRTDTVVSFHIDVPKLSWCAAAAIFQTNPMHFRLQQCRFTEPIALVRRALGCDGDLNAEVVDGEDEESPAGVREKEPNSAA